jgi:two-component system phosphate regulon response regulator PhoB
MSGKALAHTNHALAFAEPGRFENRLKLRPAKGGSPILLADKSPDQLHPVGQQLQQSGYAVAYATDGESALMMARQWPPLLVVLDKLLPNVDGFEICRTLRRETATANVPIIFASLDADETDRVLGLELGADDYLAKPFSTREMVLRIKKLLAVTAGSDALSQPRLQFDGLMIDVARHSVTIGDRTAKLTATEFRLLELLARRNNFVQHRSELLEQVCKAQADVDDRTIDTHVRRLRQKLGSAGHMLETVRGFGYRFAGQILPS